MKKFINDFVEAKSGQSMTEYAMILALVAVVVATALSPLGTAISTKLGEVVGKIG